MKNKIMLENLRDFIDLFEAGQAQNINLPRKYKKIKNIIVAGMGASSIPGQVIKEGVPFSVPFEVSRDYELPSWADRNTLLICISRSGKTKETISQFKEGLKKKCKIVTITCGEELKKQAERNEIPLILLPEYCMNKETREIFPYLLTSTLKILKETKTLKETLHLKELDIKKIEKEAKELAKKIKGTFPVICSQSPSIAFKWESDLSETSKILAESLYFPELAHNEIESWQKLNKKYCLLLLREGRERKEIEILLKGIKKLLKGKIKIIEIKAKGRIKLERMLYLICLGGFTSYFLAELNKIKNPQETKYIVKLKEELRKLEK